MENHMKWGIITSPMVTIYEHAAFQKESKGQIVSAISDEALHGMLLQITGPEEQGYYPVKTFYGYPGYISTSEISLITKTETMEWENSNLWIVSGVCVDVVSLPRVQGVRLISLFRGSVVQVISWDSEEKGWAKIRLADGKTGYMRNQYLWEKKFSQSSVWTGQLCQRQIAQEQEFRKTVIETAKTYLGTQYRWGGRSTAGIDCSGLTSVSYMLNGILTYRDAKIVEGYPIRQIPKEAKKPGDLLYFPGHIAMYIGEGNYIHSTGKVGSGGVVYNSLQPESPLYREDLANTLYAVGSLF